MKGYSATVLVAILFAAGGASAVAAEPAAPYTIDVVALTGPQGGDLTVALDATGGSAVPGAFEHIHVKLQRPGAEATEVVNLERCARAERCRDGGPRPARARDRGRGPSAGA